MTTVVNQVLKASGEIVTDRTLSSVLLHMVTEVGELAQEIQIDDGDSYKTAGDDGVIGEAIDVIACALDIICLHDPDITEETLTVIMHDKLQKWRATA